MKIAVVIPCYRTKDKIADVLSSIDKNYEIICVDDSCPDSTGRYVESLGHKNVKVLYNAMNLGVGGAVKAGYRNALQAGADVMIKIDSDGQMPGEAIAKLAELIENGADYAKGNRFYYLHNLKGMPFKRLFGNLVLSFFTKLSSGYWDLMDPTNGFTAISRKKLEELELTEIDDRYFFESDMLYKLYLLNTVIKELPMKAKYNGEISSLKPWKVLTPFLVKNIRNTCRRIIYTYFVRDFNLGSLALLLSVILGTVGVSYGALNWIETFETGLARPTGTIMLAALSLIFSIQFLVFFLTVDIQNNPNIKFKS